MNYKALVENKLTELNNDFTEYSFGEVLYSILRFSKIESTCISKLLEISDRDFITYIEKAKEFEKQ